MAQPIALFPPSLCSFNLACIRLQKGQISPLTVSFECKLVCLLKLLKDIRFEHTGHTFFPLSYVSRGPLDMPSELRLTSDIFEEELVSIRSKLPVSPGVEEEGSGADINCCGSEVVDEVS